MRAACSFLFGTALLSAAGCKASASAEANAGTTQNEEAANVDEPPSEHAAGGEPVGAPEAVEAVEAVGGDSTLLGARHDLRLAPGHATATCSCVAVAVGNANDAAMAWDGAAPQVDPQTQLVVALSSEGISCPTKPKGGLGASYWGYRQSGDNVVVYIEVARSGRPVTTGAIIPKPAGNGQVLVKPHGKDVPYGRSLAGGGHPCSLGNPGAKRTRPAAPATNENDVEEQP